MKNSISILFFLLLGCCLLSAQTYKFEILGTELKASKSIGYSLTRIITCSEDEIITFRDNPMLPMEQAFHYVGYDIETTALGTTHELVDKKQIKSMSIPDRTHVPIGDNKWIVFSIQNQSIDEWQFYRINFQALVSSQLFYTIPFENGTGGTSTFWHSIDQSKFFVINHKYKLAGSEKNNYTIGAFDDNLNELISTKFTVKDFKPNASVTTADIASDKTLYVTLKEPHGDETNSNEKESISYGYHLVQVKNEDIKSIDLGEQLGKHISQVQVILKGEEVECFGFYTGNDNASIIGAFTMNFSQNSFSLLRKETFPYSTDVLDRIYALDVANMNSQDKFADYVKKSEHIKFKKYFKNADNSSYIVSEFEFLQYNVGGDGQIARFNLDILVTKLDPNSKILWSIRIPRKNKETKSGSLYEFAYMDFFALKRADKLHFFFLDNPLNESNDELSRPYLSDRWSKKEPINLVCVTVDENGKIDKAIVATTNTPAFWPKINMGCQINENQVIFPGYYHNYKEGFIKLTVE